MKEQYGEYLAAVQQAIEAQTCLHETTRVSKAAQYSLSAGGKRVRGVLCMAVCDMLDGDMNMAEAYAAAVEMLHCYSLIHDDLPCMDNDDFRRGKPACHKAFDEATALLAGDALLTAAFEVVAEASQNAKAVSVLSKAAGAKGMILGQELDLQFETKTDDAQQLLEVHRNKTGMLMNAAVQLGAIAAKATDAQQQTLSQYAFSIGLVFQIIDDVLDVTSSAEVLGKPIGSDAQNEKTTFVTLYGIQQSKEKAAQITQQACEGLQQAFGEKSLFLQQYAFSLLERQQ